MSLNPKSPVSLIPFIGPKYVRSLDRLGIKTALDLMYHFPTRFDDFSHVLKIGQLRAGDTVTCIANVKSIKNSFSKKGNKITAATLTDETGEMSAIWFNQTYLANTLRNIQGVALAGEVSFYENGLSFINPEFEVCTGTLLHTGRIVPIYPLTQGVSSKWLRSRINYLITRHPELLMEFLPREVVSKFELPNFAYAVRNIHFPESFADFDKAKNRFAFEEVFESIFTAALKKTVWGNKMANKRFEPNKLEVQNLIDSLPFELTTSQQTVLNEILTDLQKSTAMNRLLQGDVGSGKTVIALIASYVCCLNKRAVYLMAPTEILANQHYETFKTLLGQHDIKISLNTSSSKGDYSDINIGTHALLYQKNRDQNAGLVIIDEQHRFGVKQRAQLVKPSEKTNPHVLSMTATPIPRTLALTILSDLDISFLTEKPPGRKKTVTWVISKDKREAAYRWIRDRLIASSDEQVFIVCPLIEESDTETLKNVKAAENEFKNLSQTVFKNINAGLLHGRMSAKEKGSTVESFRNGKVRVLIATSIIELGIDIPSASIVVIEGADRFGLASLHQIRGRVGRGNQKSYCIIIVDSTSFNRLKILEKYDNGIDLAEKDLAMRGPGEIIGKLQHGRLKFRFADFSDLNLIKKAKEAADICVGRLDDLPKLKEHFMTDPEKIILN